MPMPELDDDATIGDLTGVCVAEGPQERVEQSADFLVNLLSDDAVTTMAETGYLMPTKIDVNFSDAFLQPDLEPANARAFVNSTRSIVLPPLIEGWPELEAAVDPDLERLLTQPLLEDLDAELELIDEKSRAVLDPEEPDETDDPSDDHRPHGLGPLGCLDLFGLLDPLDRPRPPRLFDSPRLRWPSSPS